jgi:G:T-mismatch repair DNA endonuclease (very short patch repair protein)
MNLNLYTEPSTGRHHFSFIKHVKNIIKVFKCAECNAFLSEYKKMKRHSLTCNKGRPKIVFEEGYYQPRKTIFEQMKDSGLLVADKDIYYPYFIYFSFESWLKDSSYELLSISLIGSEETHPVFIPVERNTEDTLNTMIGAMEEIRARYIKILFERYSVYFRQLSKLSNVNKRKQLTAQLFEWIETLPIYGFDSSAFDLNIVKRYLPKLLANTGYKHGNISRAEKQWVKSVETQLNRKIETNYKIDKYNVDGYDPETNTVYEFNGCYYHGCNICYQPEDINPSSGKSMGELYKKTIKKEEHLKRLGYNVISKWSCQFKGNEIEVNDIIKVNNRYRMISNGKFIFKDILSFLSPNTSVDTFLRAFNCTVPKSFFPRKVLQNITEYIQEYPELRNYQTNIIELLKMSNIPDKKWFNHELNAKSKEKSVYSEIKNRYSNLFELLKEYSLKKVESTMNAIKRLVKFFQSLELDIHKDGISISGLSLRYLWKTKDPNSKFKLFRGNEALYEKYKDNLVGGPSIVFSHYQEKSKTLIRKNKVCQKIIGFDANALYLWAIGQDMLCGEHLEIQIYPGLVEDVMNDKFFGVIECDIKVPNHLRKYFEEMCPVFKNVEISYNHLSLETKRQVNSNYKSRKLVGSMFGTEMLFHTELLKWYIKKGIEVSNITFAVRYERKAPFKEFMDKVSNARRLGDSSEQYKLLGEMMKLIGNSSYGQCIKNMLKYENVSIIPSEKYSKNIRRNTYKSHEDLVDGYEFRFKKTQFKQNLPVQIGFTVYQLAKLRMLQFYYDFLDVYIDRSNFHLVQIDTDSAYIAISSENLEALVKPNLIEHYQLNKHNWFGRDNTKENALFDKRTPGLFKVEYEGDGIIALGSKMYYCFGEKDKVRCKGINKQQNAVTKQRFEAALYGNSTQEFYNTQLKVCDNRLTLYKQSISGLKLFNDKRIRQGFETKYMEI